MQYTSILVSTSRRFPDEGMSEMEAVREVVQGNGLCDIGDRVDWDGGFSSRIGVLV